MIWNHPKPERPVVPGVWVDKAGNLLTGRAMEDRLPGGMMRNGEFIPLTKIEVDDFVVIGDAIFVKVLGE